MMKMKWSSLFNPGGAVFEGNEADGVIEVPVVVPPPVTVTVVLALHAERNGIPAPPAAARPAAPASFKNSLLLSKLAMEKSP
jgi:hypothetical protein